MCVAKKIFWNGKRDKQENFDLLGRLCRIRLCLRLSLIQNRLVLVYCYPGSPDPH